MMREEEEKKNRGEEEMKGWPWLLQHGSHGGLTHLQEN